MEAIVVNGRHPALRDFLFDLVHCRCADEVAVLQTEQVRPQIPGKPQQPLVGQPRRSLTDVENVTAGIAIVEHRNEMPVTNEPVRKPVCETVEHEPASRAEPGLCAAL